MGLSKSQVGRGLGRSESRAGPASGTGEIGKETAAGTQQNCKTGRSHVQVLPVKGRPMGPDGRAHRALAALVHRVQHMAPHPRVPMITWLCSIAVQPVTAYRTGQEYHAIKTHQPHCPTHQPHCPTQTHCTHLNTRWRPRPS